MGEPVVNGGADAPTLDRGVARAMMAGNQQHDPVAGTNGALKPAINRLPGGVEGHPVEVEDAFGLDCAAAQTLVPATVQRALANRFGWRRRLGLWAGPGSSCADGFRFRLRRLRV